MRRPEKDAANSFDEGLYCAESVVTAIASKLGIESELIPGIATGFCSGMARTCGTCGAVTGGILGLNLALGRRDASGSVELSYAAVQQLIEEFQRINGSTNCADLLGCDLGTSEGQRTYRSEGLARRCREFTGLAADLAIGIIESMEEP